VLIFDHVRRSRIAKKTISLPLNSPARRRLQRRQRQPAGQTIPEPGQERVAGSEPTHALSQSLTMIAA